MTFIQQFIEKAFVGGWQPADRDFSIIGFYERHFNTSSRNSSPETFRYPDAGLRSRPLNPKVWQAVGKVEQWYEGHYGPEWLHHMHKMIDALAEGHTLEAYIQSVLAQSHTKEAYPLPRHTSPNVSHRHEGREPLLRISGCCA